jgi:hypothetical protein
MAAKEYEFIDEAELADFPGLMAVSQFVRMLGGVPWFGGLGLELDGREVLLAEDYLLALGFPEARIAPVANWEPPPTRNGTAIGGRRKNRSASPWWRRLACGPTRIPSWWR